MYKTKDELPVTEMGLNLYVDYCRKQIVRNENHTKQLYERITWCYERAEKYGLTIKENKGVK